MNHRALSIFAVSLALFQLNNGSWIGWGGSIYNNRWASANVEISSANARSLTEHCRISYVNGTSATPTVLHGIAYYPTWDGSLVALDYQSCEVKWKINVSAIIESFAPISTDQKVVTVPVSRTSPQVDVDNHVLYFGTQTHALIVAADLHSGKTLAVAKVNPHQLALVTTSPTFYRGMLFVGASSLEELAVQDIPGYNCCSFVGNAMALIFDRQANKFSTIWNRSMLPSGAGGGPGTWSGASIWGSQPSIDPRRGQVFFATGNLYSAPEEYLKCENATRVKGSGKHPCLPLNVWQESVVAIDIYAGRLNWVRQLTPLDAWTVACGIPGSVSRNPALCPQEPGPDADFGMAPTFVPGGTEASGALEKDTVVIGQKNGNLYLLAADTGELEWSTATSPGGISGGLSWGVSVDDQRVYFTAINYDAAPWTPQPSNNMTTIRNSGFGAASLSSGELLWEIAAPHNNSAYVPPSVVGDVVLTGRTGQANTADSPGGLLVLNKATGEILLDYPLDATFHGGIAVQGRYIMFGTGYRQVANGSFYVLTVGC
jgi:outer membrane protein assembly factor BamB